jgi:micrococcal nuclease
MVASMTKIARRAIMAVAATATILVSPPTVAADPVDATATVLKVVDGDTIDIRDDVRGRLRVRVLGSTRPRR